VQTLKEFIEKYEITMGVKETDANPNMEQNPKHPMRHYDCLLMCPGRRLTVPFSMGMAPGSAPEVDAVLDCLAMESMGAEGVTFEAWAWEYGYDTDSRKAEKVYKACAASARKLKRLLKEAEIYDELLYKTERL